MIVIVSHTSEVQIEEALWTLKVLQWSQCTAMAACWEAVARALDLKGGYGRGCSNIGEGVGVWKHGLGLQTATQRRKAVCGRG